MKKLICLIAAMASLLSSTGSINAAEPKRPNILFAFADDWGRYASIFAAVEGAGSMNDVIKTPNIDRIAREGVLFRRAYVNAPSCTPCRSSLLSGQYFWRTGRAAILQGAVWDSKTPSFPLLLNDAGYHIGQTYKVWSPGTPNDAPFGGEKFAYEKAGGKFNNFSENCTQMVKKGQPLEEAKAELYRDVTGNFEAFLADRKPDQPFCYWFGPTNVHRMWERGSGKALWGIEPDSLKGKLPKFLPDVSDVREDIADYFGEIQAFDHAVGLLLKRLEEVGELDNTLVVVSGDHGPPGFTHGKCNLYDFGTNVTLAIRGAGTRGGRVLDDFVGLPDLAPTFLEIAGLKPPDVMTARSLVPVLRSEKSGQVEPQRSFALTGRERHVEDARDGFLPYPQRAIRTKDYLYIINFEPDRWPLGNPYKLGSRAEPDEATLANDTRVTLSDMDASPTKAWLISLRDEPVWKPFYELAFAKRPREQLFVIADDPDQIQNVAADPKYESVRAELNQKLMSELTRTNDPRVTGDKQFFEKPPMAGPLAEPRNKNRPGKSAAGYMQDVKRIGVDEAAGMSQAVVVEADSLVYTAQLLPITADGELIGNDAESQAVAVFDQLDAVLKREESDLDRVVKLNVYVANPEVATVVRKSIARNFANGVKPAVSFVQTRLPHPDALVALDAIGIATGDGRSMGGKGWTGGLPGRPRFAQVAAISKDARVVYVSGQAEKGMDVGEATTKTLASLEATLKHLDRSLDDVRQVKCFLTPMSDVHAAQKAIAASFAPTDGTSGSGLVPPCVFVEWQSSLPIEIELVAAGGVQAGLTEPLEFITPPGMTASPVFCRVVRVNDPRTIFVSGLFAKDATDGTGQVTQVFEQLQDILKASGSDLRHLAKATYYVSDNDASAKLNELRPKFYDPQRPPAASKAQVLGVGVAGRSLTLDMIAVPK